MSKTFLKLFVTAVAVTMLAACSDSGSTSSSEVEAPTKGKIAVLLPDKGTDDKGRFGFIDRPFLEQSFKAAGLTDAEFTIIDADFDADTQVRQAKEVVADGATVVLFTAISSEAGARAHAELDKPGVKVIDYDRLVPNGKADYFVGFDNESVGRLMGEGLVSCLNTKGVKNPTIFELNGSQDDSNVASVKKGYDSVLDPMLAQGWTKVPDEYVTGWKKEKATELAQKVLGDHREIDGVVSGNDAVADSVITAAKQYGMSVSAVGQDALSYAIQHILVGEQCMTVYKPIQAEAGAAAHLALELREGQTPTNTAGKVSNGATDVPAILATPVAVTKDNVRETVIKDKFVAIPEVCTPDYAAACAAANIK